MPPLEDEEEDIKEGKGWKTLNKLLTSLPILLAQILNLLYQHDKITKKVYNNLIKSYRKKIWKKKKFEENMIVIRGPERFYFIFDWPEDVDENLKHEIEFITKRKESLAVDKIINEIEQLLLKYKHGNGNNFHEQEKQQKNK